MKILLVNNLYAPYGRGGAEKAVALTAQGSIMAGHDAAILTSCPPFAGRTATIDGISVRYVPSFFFWMKKMPVPLRLLWHVFSYLNPLSAWRIRKAIKDISPELVITNNLTGFAPLLPRLIPRGKSRHIHILHDIQLLHPSGLMMYGQEGIIDTRLARLYQAINRRVYCSTGMAVSPSRWLLDLHRSRGYFKGQAGQVLPNPDNSPMVKPANENKAGDRTVFLYVGRLSKAKGYYLLMDAWDLFRRSVTAKTASYELWVMSYDVKVNTQDDGIRHISQNKHHEAIKAMGQADCLIVPSLCYENSPTVICEAASVGLPVIGSSLGGIPELLKKVGGEPFKPEAAYLAQMMERLIISGRQPVRTIKKAGLNARDYAIELIG